jgi:hypothetical protein
MEEQTMNYRLWLVTAIAVLAVAVAIIRTAAAGIDTFMASFLMLFVLIAASLLLGIGYFGGHSGVRHR